MRNLILDTNVLLNDPTAIYKFHEHHIYLPTMVLDELDSIKDKKGKEGVLKEAKEVIRIIDSILGKSKPDEIQSGVDIVYPENMKDCHGKLSIISTTSKEISDIIISNGLSETPDSKIIAAALYLQQSNEHETTLVSQDVNMRLIASANGVRNVEPYFNEHILGDLEHLDPGVRTLPVPDLNSIEFGQRMGNVDEYGKGYALLISIDENLVEEPYPGLTLKFNDENQTLFGTIISIEEGRCWVEQLDENKLMNQTVWGIKPRSIDQALLIHFITDPNVDFICGFGPAGSGKTLVSLAGSIHNVITAKTTNGIVVSRPTTNLDEDLGFMPGDETSKMTVWLGAFEDALEVMHKGDEKPSNASYSSVEYTVEKSNLSYRSINYMRGRSFDSKNFILDEAQNITAYQAKSILTRAGTGTKAIFLGNLNQIDHGSLTPRTSGLSHLVINMKNYPNGRAIYLSKKERSQLSDFAEEFL